MKIIPSELPPLSGALIPVEKPLAPVVSGPLLDITEDVKSEDGIRVRIIDVRHMSPREMLKTSTDLYIAGVINWDEYELLAFQPELHPDYNKTVGALLGRTAQPDLPQDHIQEWEDRLAFERRHSTNDSRTIRHIEHILSIFRQIEDPVSLEV